MVASAKVIFRVGFARNLPSFARRGMDETPLTRRRSSSRSLSSSGTNYLVVGLGNHTMPETRHSIGMTVVNHIADKLDVTWRYSKSYSGYYCTTQINQLQVILFKSKLLMNVNGKSVFKIASLNKIQPSHILLIHDDLDKILGKYSFKNGGSARGHNGVKSVIASFKSCEFKRLLLGIGRPADKSQVVSYVLQKFNDQEKEVVSHIIEECSQAVLEHLKTFQSDENSETS